MHMIRYYEMRALIVYVCRIACSNSC